MTPTVARVLALHWLGKQRTRWYDDARRAAAEYLQPGDRRTARMPDGRPLGWLAMSDPDPEVRITDEDALTAWYAHHYPDRIETVPTVVGDPDEVAAVLAAYAPHLVQEHPRLRDWARSELTEVSVTAGEPVGPGGETALPGVQVNRPPPRLTPSLSPGAGEIMAELLSGDRLAIDGSLRELEA